MKIIYDINEIKRKIWNQKGKKYLALIKKSY